MSRVRLGIAVVATGMLAVGCFGQSQSTPKPQHETSQTQTKHITMGPLVPTHLTTPEQDNRNTPDLAGGPEAGNREPGPAYPTPQTHDLPESSQTLYFEGAKTAKQVALTFDDGPDVHFTTQILDILKANGIKATFFIVGTRAQAHPEMVHRIVGEGHAIGNHTWDHPFLPHISPDQIQYEIEQTDGELFGEVGFHPALFRPPYGATTPDIVREVAGLHMKVIDWSVDTRDWAGTPSSQILAYVRKEVSPGGIILQHCAGGKNDKLSNTVEALPQIISYLRGQGYSFVTVPDLLHIPDRYS